MHIVSLVAPSMHACYTAGAAGRQLAGSLPAGAGRLALQAADHERKADHPRALVHLSVAARLLIALVSALQRSTASLGQPAGAPATVLHQSRR